MKCNTILEHGRSVAFTACALLIGASVMQSCKDDDLILTGQPSWLGNSIYERLQDEGNYKYTLRLIDELGEKDVLSHTGSRTLFVAADSAYEAWFKDNKWGVSQYEDLTLPQKKLLLRNSMIDNAYLLELMSNETAEGDAATPEWGRTMRRTTSASAYDSVYVMQPDEMPDNAYWASKRGGHAIRILKDVTEAPMIHFLPAYLQNHKITAEDLNLLTNHRATSINEAWVNGVKVVNSGDPEKKKIDYDVTCKNGYIQKVERVIESSPNMAQLVYQDDDMSTWAHLLDRYAVPYFDKTLWQDYNRNYKNSDSLFVLRYAAKSYYNGSRKTTIDRSSYDTSSDNGKYVYNDERTNQKTVIPYDELLRFDPGWNQYIDDNQQNTLHNDAGMMIVPTNQAVQEWWNGPGKSLQDEYVTLDNVPTPIMTELINVNMIPTFSTYVPSKFASVLNDAKEPLGITKNDIVQCYMGCNGVVYKVSKVFTPALFASVAYPALAHASTMNIIYSIIDGRTFKPYLLSMDSKYALILPSNNAMQLVLDPASFGRSATTDDVKSETPYILEFTFNKEKQQVECVRYKSTVDENGEIVKGDKLGEVGNTGSLLTFRNRLYDSMMNYLIIVLPDKNMTVEKYVAQGYKYFKTKGGGLIKVTNVGGKLQFQGGWQVEHNRNIPAVDRYDMENGSSYLVEDMVPTASQKSVYITLQEHPEFSKFLTMMENDYNNVLTNMLNNKYYAGQSWVNSKNLRLLDNYNYTVYVPTNEAIEKLQDEKILPTDEELDRGDFDVKTKNDPKVDSICIAEGWYPDGATEAKKADIRAKVVETLTTIMSDFIRYHVQDHSVAIGMVPEVEVDDNGNVTHYKSHTSFESMKRDLETGRFIPLEVNYTNNSMTVKDNTVKDANGKVIKAGVTHNVVTSNGLYNLQCREYWFEGKNSEVNASLFMASDVVVHQIDGVLLPGVKRPWRDIVKEALGVE